jgi:hypothetical protein
MTQRSIMAGQTPKVIVHAGGSVSVEGWESDRVQADTDSRRGLKVERHSASEFGRARAKVGDRVLFDVRLNVPNLLKKNTGGEVIDVQIGGSCTVHVPSGSQVKVYGGMSVDVRQIRGTVTVYAGSDVTIRQVNSLVHASAGGKMDFECDAIEGNDAKFAAGRDLRCYIKSLANAKVMVNDLGGYWEAILGDGQTRLRLEAGGDATLVTDQAVNAQPPQYVLGKVERPPGPIAANNPTGDA